MLKLTFPAVESWDAEKEEFVAMGKPQTIYLEHSLVSISKWESKWCKSFLSNKKSLTTEEVFDYIKCMFVTKDVDDSILERFTQEHIDSINEYISAPMTATVFYDDTKQTGGKQTVTSELIYYWMIAHNIPMECQKWHINRLLTLIRVCNVKNAPPKKMSKKDIISKYASLNASRRKQFKSNG